VALLSRYANSAASIIDMSASPHKGELDEFLANDSVTKVRPEDPIAIAQQMARAVSQGKASRSC
jgi:hypothetical protein